MRIAEHSHGGIVLDELARRIRQLVRDVHARELSGVERFRVLTLSPLRIGQVEGELALEDGDPDFTVGEGLRAQLNAGVVSEDDLVWVVRHDGEWHALDTVGAGLGFKTGGAPDGPAGGDLSGTYPNPTVAKLQGRAVSSAAPASGQALVWDPTSGSWKPTTLANSYPPSGAAGGDLTGSYPNPTVAKLAGVPIPSLVTSLPGTPTDGQVVDYLADATNGVVWRLRYRSASTSAHKWERVGGASLFAGPSGSISGVAAEVALSGGPSITVPLAGDYRVISSAFGQVTDAIAVTITCSLAVNAVDRGSPGQVCSSGQFGAGEAIIRNRVSLNAGDVLTLRVETNNTTYHSTWNNGYIDALPTRVG